MNIFYPSSHVFYDHGLLEPTIPSCLPQLEFLSHKNFYFTNLHIFSNAVTFFFIFIENE